MKGGGRLRAALILTEGNLGSMIASRTDMGMTENSNVMQAAMSIWRREVRKALGWRLDL